MNPSGKPPPYIRWVNELGIALESAGASKPELHADQLITHAQRRTGLHNWGDESFKTGLDELTTALGREANLSQIGRITAYWNLLDLLCIRLRLLDYRTKRPEVAAQQIKRPLFILGLPRTGTTILYELIAQDPSFRSPASWEVARPVPPPTAPRYQSDRRIKSVDRLLAILEKLTPGFRAIHAIGAKLPQECVYLLASSFISEQFGYMYNIPGYRSWALDQDMTAPYQWHAGFLQHLQVDLEREHWVLKTPAHLGYLKYLLGQYPDAAIVWTHRRPLDAIASFSSLAHTLRSGFSSSVDRIATGEFEFEHSARVVLRGMADRDTLDSRQFIDVSFNAICADPMKVIAAIYERFGVNLSHEAESAMRRYLRGRPRDLYGEHSYFAGEFGLDTAGEQALYSEYLAQYGHYL